MRSGLVQLARGLRRAETNAEEILWRELRNRQLDGWRFKRQVPFGRYILDFFCFDARLAIEIDGATHSEPREVARDEDRTAFLCENGVRVVRVSGEDVESNIEGVVESVFFELGQQPAPSPALRARLSPRGEADQAVVAHQLSGGSDDAGAV